MPNLKQSALQIFHETLAAIDIPSAMHRKLGRAGSRILVNGGPIDLAAFERICTVAIGKASVAMARNARGPAPESLQRFARSAQTLRLAMARSIATGESRPVS